MLQGRGARDVVPARHGRQRSRGGVARSPRAPRCCSASAALGLTRADWQYRPRGSRHLDRTLRARLLRGRGAGGGDRAHRPEGDRLSGRDPRRSGAGGLWREARAAIARVARDGVDGASARPARSSSISASPRSMASAPSRSRTDRRRVVLAYIERTQLGARPPLSPPGAAPLADRRCRSTPRRAPTSSCRGRSPASGRARCSIASI